MKFNDGQEYSVSVYLNKKFLCLITNLVYGIYYADHEVDNITLSPKVDNKTLGENILLALSKSRTLSKKNGDNLEIICRDYTFKKYKEWYLDLMQKYSFKTKKHYFLI
jgi:hypothetical protein